MGRRPGLIGPLLRLGGAVALGVAARERLAKADEQARAQIYNRRVGALDEALPHLTDLGSTYAIGGAALALSAVGKRSLARDVAVAGGLAWSASQVMKLFYRRARPYDSGDVPISVRKPAGTSYPSGHPAVAAAVARVLDSSVHEPARAFISRLPRMVAFSRVYVGVHYPTDVIGGLMLGRAIGDLWLRYAPRN